MIMDSGCNLLLGVADASAEVEEAEQLPLSLLV